MYLFFNDREQKAQLISIGVNALIADGVLTAVFHPTQPIPFMIMWFIGIVTFQFYLLYFPMLIQKYFFKKLTPLEEQLMLKKKIKLIHEEISMLNNRHNRKNKNLHL
jgi:hypothetical protein